MPNSWSLKVLCHFRGLCSKCYTFFTTFAALLFAAHRKFKLAQFFCCLKADCKGLILSFEILEFRPHMPELRHFLFVLKNVNLPHFFPLLILVLRVFGRLPLNPSPTAKTTIKLVKDMPSSIYCIISFYCDTEISKEDTFKKKMKYILRFKSKNKTSY